MGRSTHRRDGPEEPRHAERDEQIRDERAGKRERRGEPERVAHQRQRGDRDGRRLRGRARIVALRVHQLREHHPRRELREARGEEEPREPRVTPAGQLETNAARGECHDECGNEEVRRPELAERAEEIRVHDVQLQDEPDEPPRRRDVEERPRKRAHAGEAQHRPQSGETVGVAGHEQRARKHDEVHRNVEREEAEQPASIERARVERRLGIGEGREGKADATREYENAGRRISQPPGGAHDAQQRSRSRRNDGIEANGQRRPRVVRIGEPGPGAELLDENG